MKRSRIRAPVAELERWHRRPGALERLTPPWEPVEVVRPAGAGEAGARVTLRVGKGPLRLRWTAEHRELENGPGFRDVQADGPFPRWEHTHRFRPAGPDETVLEDRVDYELPGGALGRILGARALRRRLERSFAYRHRTLADDLETHRGSRQHREAGPEALRVAVTGSTGLIGSALVPFLTTGGHRVTRLVRRDPGPAEEAVPAEREVRWDPIGGFVDTAALEGTDAVVHLAGENLAAVWTPGKKTRIRNSRVQGTRNLSRALAQMERPPRVLISASGVSYYGDRGSERLREGSAPGSGFLAGVCREWEAAAELAEEAGIRVVRLRFGVVLTPRGGALGAMLPAFRLGLGATVGSGRQFLSWISIDDLLGVIHHAIRCEKVRGAVNAVSPRPVRMRELTEELGRVLSRKVLFRIPASPFRLAPGGMADETLLASAYVEPTVLEDTGYRFRHPGLGRALRHLLGRTRTRTAGAGAPPGTGFESL